MLSYLFGFGVLKEQVKKIMNLSFEAKNALIINEMLRNP